jgi:tetratricopeptide (TPR) repeat protein
VQRGALKEARSSYATILPELRERHQDRDVARVLTDLSQIDSAEGQYRSALDNATEAATIFRRLNATAEEARAWMNAGLAEVNSGSYPTAQEHYNKALALYRTAAHRKGEIDALNNLGNTFYFQGAYADAYRRYDEALQLLEVHQNDREFGHERQLTWMNLANLYQRLGRYERALDYYSKRRSASQDLNASEQAQLLRNLGALYRRLGDPAKALETYRTAQALFRTCGHRDGEARVLINIGILLAFDLKRLPDAVQASSAALSLAEKTSNRQLIVQARRYRGEFQLRLGNLDEATDNFESSLNLAGRLGLAEEKWKALFGLGRIAQQRGAHDVTLKYLRQAVAEIESIHAKMGHSTLRGALATEERDVYDALIAALLEEPQPQLQDLFDLMENSRGRALLNGKPPDIARPMSISGVSSRLSSRTIVLEFWQGSNDAAMLWISRSGSGIVHRHLAPGSLDRIHARGRDSLEGDGESWEPLSPEVGSYLASFLTCLAQADLQHLILVPDGILKTVPLELLRVPGGNADSFLIVERYDVSYLPAASLIKSQSAYPRKEWAWPWQRRLLAFADPSMPAGSSSASTDVLPPDNAQLRLPESAAEALSVGRIVGGRSEIHLTADARKEYLLKGRSRGIPLVLFSTHAVADADDPARSRIVLAPAKGSASFDYLFAEEAYNLDLTGVDLVTVSACDAGKSRPDRAGRASGFQTAFLAAGARSTITALWSVGDRSAEEFMQQFYYYLSKGESKASALRLTKLKFLHSNNQFSQPRYWAPFVLYGEGNQPIATLFPWTYLCASVGATLLTVGLTALGASHLKRSQGQDGPGIGIAQQSYCSKLIRAANLDRTSGLGSSSTEDLSK